MMTMTPLKIRPVLIFDFDERDERGGYLLLLMNSYVDSGTKFAVRPDHHRHQSHFSLCLRCVTMVDVGGSPVGGSKGCLRIRTCCMVVAVAVEWGCRLRFLYRH